MKILTATVWLSRDCLLCLATRSDALCLITRNSKSEPVSFYFLVCDYFKEVVQNLLFCATGMIITDTGVPEAWSSHQDRHSYLLLRVPPSLCGSGGPHQARPSAPALGWGPEISCHLAGLGVDEKKAISCFPELF